MESKDGSQPSFEEALSGLEAIIALMEKGDVPLADLVARYQEASKLLVRCRACLDQAAMTIERLRADAGNVSVEPFARDGQ